MKLEKVVNKPAQDVAKTITHNSQMELLARLGYVANGILHGLIGFAAIMVAFGSTQEVDQSGVLGPLAHSVFGAMVIFAIFVALVSLGIWKIAVVVDARRTHKSDTVYERLQEIGKAIVYLGLGITTGALLFNHASTTASIDSSRHLTLRLLQLPVGLPLLYGFSLLLAVVGVGFVVRGARRKFLDSLHDAPARLNIVVVVCGVVGYIAKGMIFIVLAGVFFSSTRTFDPDRATGLDAAFRSFIAVPFGAFLLMLIGIGFVMYGCYSIARAHLSRM